jgi:hypothetical protein
MVHAHTVERNDGSQGGVCALWTGVVAASMLRHGVKGSRKLIETTAIRFRY